MRGGIRSFAPPHCPRRDVGLAHGSAAIAAYSSPVLSRRATAALSSVADPAVVQDRLDITLALASAMFTVTAVVQLTADHARAVWIPSVVALATAAVFAIGCALVRGRHGQFFRHPTLWPPASRPWSASTPSSTW